MKDITCCDEASYIRTKVFKPFISHFASNGVDKSGGGGGGVLIYISCIGVCSAKEYGYGF